MMIRISQLPYLHRVLRFCCSSNKTSQTINPAASEPQKEKYASEIIVPSSFNSIRLDKFLKEQYHISWNILQTCLRKKEIYVKQPDIGTIKHRNPDYALKTGDLIRIPSSLLVAPQKQQSTDPQIDSNQFSQMIIYENTNIIVLNKLNGISSQGGKDVERNLVTLGTSYLSQSSFGRQKFLVAHRLDKVTSGVLMVPKNQVTASIFGHLFTEKLDIQKYYIALVEGTPKFQKGLINQPIDYSESKHKAIISNFNSKPAHTHYEVLAQFLLSTTGIITSKLINEQKDFDSGWGNMSLLKVRIQEGRKHQIRVHLSEILKTPVLGDVRYACKNPFSTLFEYQPDDAIFLHSYQTKIKSQSLSNRIKSNCKYLSEKNENGLIDVQEDTISIQAEFPPHFKTLISRAFSNETEFSKRDQLFNFIKAKEF